LLEDLSLVARAVVNERSRPSVEAEFLSFRDSWVGGFNQPVHHVENLLNVNSAIHQEYVSEMVDILTARAKVLESIYSLTFAKTLRYAFLNHIVDGHLSLLDLGACVDQGLRPAGVATRLFDPKIAANENRRQGEVGRQEPPWYLANRTWEPGELPPDSGWPSRVRALWREVGIPGELSTDSLPSSNCLNPESQPRCVEAVDAAIRNGLNGLDHAHDTAVSERPRIVIKLESQSVSLDRCTITVGDPGALRIFQRIAECHGALTSVEELNRIPGCRGRIDRRIKDHLPLRLRDLIRSKAGPGGGYWLHLPPG
jgi:hypothetical protein